MPSTKSRPGKAQATPRNRRAPGADRADRTSTINSIPVNSTEGAVSEYHQLPVTDAITDDVELAKSTLRAVMRDPNAPAAARAQAARTLAEMSGALGKNAKPPAETGKPLAEMSRAELEAELAALENS